MTAPVEGSGSWPACTQIVLNPALSRSFTMTARVPLDGEHSGTHSPSVSVARLATRSGQHLSIARPERLSTRIPSGGTVLPSCRRVEVADELVRGADARRRRAAQARRARA